MMNILQVAGVFADAVLVDQFNRLLFISLWGRDTSLKEMLAALQIGKGKDGFDQFTLRDANGVERLVWAPDVNRLQKEQGRMPKRSALGEIAHLWIYDHLLREYDRANRRALLISQSGIGDDVLWPVVRDLCHLPLLPHWQAPVLEALKIREWIVAISGINVQGVMINLGDDGLEPVISSLIERDVLRLEAA